MRVMSYPATVMAQLDNQPSHSSYHVPIKHGSIGKHKLPATPKQHGTNPLTPRSLTMLFNFVSRKTNNAMRASNHHYATEATTSAATPSSSLRTVILVVTPDLAE